MTSELTSLPEIPFSTVAVTTNRGFSNGISLVTSLRRISRMTSSEGILSLLTNIFFGRLRVCRKPALFDGLEVDQYVWGILQHLTTNPHAVEVTIDHTASWRPLDPGQSVSSDSCLPKNAKMQKTLVVQLIQRFPILFDLLLKIAPYRGSLAPQLRVNNYIFHRNAYLFRLHTQLKGIIVNFDLTFNYCDCWACFSRASYAQ